MTEDSGQHLFDRGQAAYDSGDLVTALRWWLQGIDVGSDASLTAAIEVSRSDDQASPWNWLLEAMRYVHDEPAISKAARLSADDSSATTVEHSFTDSLAIWSQFSLSPVPDLAVLAQPMNGTFEPIADSQDPEWQRIMDYLEYRDVIVEPIGTHLIGGNWQGDYEWSVPIFFGIEPPGKPDRKLRISTPLLIGLPEPDMAPNLGSESTLPQAGFLLPLRPVQLLFARACLALADQGGGLVNFAPLLRFAGVPSQMLPIPRISAGPARWIIGPNHIYALRYPLPQVSMGYEIDLSLSGPHLDAAVSGAVDALVLSASRANEACASNSGVFCEYITSITTLTARRQWTDLFANYVYPSEFAETTLHAEVGDLEAMVALGATLAVTPGLEADAFQWYDAAISLGYAPGLASKTRSLLVLDDFAQAAETWSLHHQQCHEAAHSAPVSEQDHLLKNFMSAHANAAVADYLRGGNPQDSLSIWERLADQGHAESRIYLELAPLMSGPAIYVDDYQDAGRRISKRFIDGNWLHEAYPTIAQSFLLSKGAFKEWCRHALGVGLATGLPLRFEDPVKADEARTLARLLIDSGEETLGAPLQEAATRLGLPYAGADHSWRMLEQGRFIEAINLYEEASSAVQEQLTRIRDEVPDLVEVWEREWANYQSNIALCHIFAGNGNDWALDVWRAGASTGNVESMFYPAVVALRSEDIQTARDIVDAMEGDRIAAMTTIALEGSRSRSDFWREWSQDGLRLLQERETLGSALGHSSGSLSEHKTSSGLGSSLPPDSARPSASSQAPDTESGGYRFCPECGSARVPGGRFCVSCGFAFP